MIAHRGQAAPPPPPPPPAPPPPHPDPGRWNPPAHGPVCKGCPNIIFSLTDDQDVALGGWYVNFGIPFGGTLFLSFSTLYTIPTHTRRVGYHT